MRRGENFVDYGKYLRCPVSRYWRILQEERRWGVINTWHHVLTGNLKRGAWQKRNLSKNRLEAEFAKYGLNMNEGLFLAAAIHSVLNRLFDNRSPPVIFANLNCMIESKLLDCNTKQLFTKFVLYIVNEKLDRKIASREFGSLEELNEFVESISQKAIKIHLDVNNGNHMNIQDIMSFFGVTRDEMVHFLNKNFLPKDWTRFPKELWDLSL